ncbi:hypothetical protein B0H17DRAFT_966916, partial [Mycena rosella]
KHFPALLTALKNASSRSPPLSCLLRRHLSHYSKHTMSDARSSMAASTTSLTVATKELLKAGFGEGLDYLEGITIH